MRFGSFLEFSCPEGASTAESYRRSFAHVDMAETLGLDIICLAEFHFTPNRVISSPLTLAAAIAGSTRRIKVGTSVLILPLGNPLRIAEETATLDHVSEGRFELGVGRSGFQVAYEGYGIPYGESRDRFWEALDVITKAWTMDRFSHEGRFYSYDNVCLVPKPLQSQHPPIRVAATSNDTFPLIGRMGFPLLIGLRTFPLAQVAEQVESYRRAWKEAGHEGTPDVSLRIPVYLADAQERAIAEPEESFMRQFRRLATQLSESATRPGADQREQRPERADTLAEVSWEDVRREKVIVGTPEMALEQIERLQEMLGFNEVVAEFNAGELIPPESIERSLRLLSERIIPALR